MRLCQPHWDDLKRRLPEGGWLLANILTLQLLPNHVNPAVFGGDIYKAQAAVEEKGGCPVCFAGEKLLDQAIAETKKAASAPSEGYA